MPRTDAARSPTDTREGVLVAVLMGVTAVSGIISSLGAPLIPSVARSLHTSLDDAQWSLTVALLMACVAAPIMGRLGDGRHRRTTILGGLAIVLVGSIVAGLASSLPVLVVGRAMQGVGLGLAPVTMAAARDHLPRDRVAGVIGSLSVCGAAAVGAGYPISGLIDSDLGLHAAFLFGAVIAAVALVVAVMVIPAGSDRGRGRLNMAGAAVLSAALVALVLAISEGQTWGWGAPITLALLVAGIAGLGLWARTQLRHPFPLVELRQLRHRSVLTADLAALALGLTFYMFLTLVTEFVQEPRATGYGLGASSLVAGLCLVPFSAASLLTSRSMRRLSHRIDAATILVGGSLVIAAAGAFFALAHAVLWEVLVAMGGLGMGFGYTFAAIPGMITGAVPAGETGSATGLYQVVRYIGFSLGSALAASILASYTADHGRTALQGGYVTAMWVSVGICLVSALASRVLARTRRPVEAAELASAVEDAELASAVEDAELASAGLAGAETDS